MLIKRSTLLKILKEQFWDKQIPNILKEFQAVLEGNLKVSFIATDKDRQNLKLELFKLKRQFREQQRKGGRQTQAYLEKLELSMYDWQVSIDIHHPNPQALLAENTQLLNTVKYLVGENVNLQKKLTETSELLNKSKSENTNNDFHFKKRKPLSECSKSHQSKVRKIESEFCRKALSFLEGNDCTLISVNVLRNGKQETISLIEKLEEAKENTGLTPTQIEEFNTLVYILDSFNISKAAYHEISMMYAHLPRSYKLSDYIAHLNSKYNIFNTPDGCGVQQSLCQRIKDVVQGLIEVDTNFSMIQELKVKLSGDGTKVGKSMNFINFSFTILNEIRCGSAQGNYILAIVKTKESYEELSHALSDLRQEVQELQGFSLQIRDKNFVLKIYLGGDYKFLLLATGIKSIQSEYNCIYCQCGRKDRGDLTKSWSILDKEQGARGSYMALGDVQRSESSSFSVVRKPLFSCIPLTDVVIDNLHLFLRVMDKLISLLVGELRSLDNISSQRSFKSGFDKEKMRHVAQLENVFQQMGINFKFYVNAETSKLEYSDLQGPDKLVLLEKFQVADLGFDESRAVEIQKLWDMFRYLNQSLKSSTPNPEEFADKAGDWCRMFVLAYQTRDITPYMHIMCYHVSELMKLHGNLVSFTQQGLEKANDIITNQYFRTSNHKGHSALKQIVEKQNRLVEFSNFQRAKQRDVTCSSCKTAGHRCTNCPA